MTENEKVELREHLERKVKLLNSTTWEGRVPKTALQDWISQFDEAVDIDADEQMQVLFLLSHFLYFGQAEIRSLLRSLYRDMIRSPVLREIRRAQNDSLDVSKLHAEYQNQEKNFRFLALGNPSESSMHLLYYFRQENLLPKDLFINGYEIFQPTISGRKVEWALGSPNVERYIFLDDMCGSGNQAIQYVQPLITPLRTLAQNIRVDYYVLFGTSSGLEAIRNLNEFDTVRRSSSSTRPSGLWRRPHGYFVETIRLRIEEAFTRHA